MSQMKKAARDMMSGLKLGPGSSHGHFEVYHDANPIREGDGKVYEGVGLEVALISLPGQIHQGRQKRYLRSGVDFIDVTLVYKDANQHKAHKIILS